MANFKLDIFTPFSHYLSIDVNFVSVVGEEFVYGILPGHAPIITKVKISKLKVKTDDSEQIYAIGGGVMQIDDDHNMKLLVSSIESKTEIDYERALRAKERAEARIANNNNDIDLKRAHNSLMRALNRIDIYNS